MRALAGIPDGYQVLFLQGGASLQFSMVPMNLLTAGATADYIVTGVVGQKAVKEAKTRRQRRTSPRPTEADNFSAARRRRAEADAERAPTCTITSNETIQGVELQARADVGRRAARLRRLVGHLQPADRRREVRR